MTGNTRGVIRSRLLCESLEVRCCLSATVSNVGNFNPTDPFVNIKDIGTAGAYLYIQDDHTLLRTDGTGAGTIALTDLGSALADTHFTSFDGKLYFQGYHPNTGFDLWRSDGTVAGTTLVKNLSSNLAERTISSIRVFNNQLYFVNDGELYTSDGTSAGTIKAIDLFPGISDNIINLTVHNSALYFTTGGDSKLYQAKASGGGINALAGSPLGNYSNLTSTPGSLYFNANGSLWRFNDTAVEFTPLSFATSSLAEVNGVVFFAGGDRLYSTDGTVAGTQEVAEVGGNVSNLTNFQGTLYFSGGSRMYLPGNELWRSNGNAANTLMIKDIEPATQLYFGGYLGEDSNPSHFTAFNGQLYFLATSSAGVASPANGLWKTDGTASGTVQVHRGPVVDLSVHGNKVAVAERSKLIEANVAGQITDVKRIGSGTASLTPNAMAELNGQHLLFGNTGQVGNELYRFNIDNTLTLIKDLTPGEASTEVVSTAVSNGLLYFVTRDALINTARLYRTDGTAAGTIMLHVFARVDSIVPYKNQTIFAALDQNFDSELWTTDGTVAGTKLLKDIYPGLDVRGFPLGSSPQLLTEFNGKLYFTAETSAGREVWMTDGTAVGTALALDLQPGASGSNPSWMRVYQNRLFIGAAFNGAQRIFRSEGTPGGTTLLTPSFQSFGESMVVGNTLYFAGQTATEGMELWKVSGNTAVLLKNIYPGAAPSNPSLFTTVNGTLYFRAYDPLHGVELWQSNGTAATTILLREARVGPIGSYPTPLASLNGVLFFQANDGVHGNELWQTNGGTASSILVKDILPGVDGSNPSSMFVRGQDAFFAAGTPALGVELYRVRSAPPNMLLPTVSAPFVGSGPVRVAPSAQVTDADNATLFGGTLTVSLAASYRTGDQVILVATPTVSVSGSTVFVDGISVGRFIPEASGQQFKINFNQNATLARVREVLRAVAYNHTKTPPTTGQRTVRFDLTDGSSAQAFKRVVRISV